MEPIEKLISTVERTRLYLEQVSHLSQYKSDYELIHSTADVAITELKEALDLYYSSLK